MDEDYFKSIRTVGSTLDAGIASLQDTWKLPNLLLCKSSENDQLAAKKLADDLRSELRQLRATIEENKAAVSSLRETHTQFLEESTKAIKSLKEEVDEIKVLFLENGYAEEPVEPDLTILTSQLEALSFEGAAGALVHQLREPNSDSSTGFADSSEPTAMLYDSPVPTDTREQLPGTPANNSFGSVQMRSLMDERPVEPIYSPYYYKMMKK